MRLRMALTVTASAVIHSAMLCAAEPEIGFTLYMTTPDTNAPKHKVVAAQMKSRTVEERDGKTRIVWRGHPVCGEDFSVTAELTPTPEKDGWEYGFGYAGNQSGLGVRFIDFPILTVPRTDKTEIFWLYCKL